MGTLWEALGDFGVVFGGLGASFWSLESEKDDLSKSHVFPQENHMTLKGREETNHSCCKQEVSPRDSNMTKDA